MPKFRKKPIVVEAVQLTEEVQIETLEGVMTGRPGDWLITGVNGEKYPCKPDIFEATYEPVGDCSEPIELAPTPYEKGGQGDWKKPLQDEGILPN